MTQNLTHMSAFITGSGGGGGKAGGGGGGTEYANTLRSTATARVLELISEGPIVGLATGDGRSIYLDGTPLLNDQLQPNFEGVTWEFRNGWPDQPAFNGLPMAETPIQVEARVKQSQMPPQRTVSERYADAVRVVVRIPSLASQNKESGDIMPTSVQYAIDVRPNKGQWYEAVNHNIFNQKCVSPYQKAHRIELPEGGYPWDIRVRRITADSDKVELQNETWWESYTVITEGRFTYPHSALCYLQVRADQFRATNIPSRAFDIKGLIINVPSNYDPELRHYTGMWDGTFKQAWTNNPAWVLYDILTNDRYGIGEFVDTSKIDKWSLYQIAQYCDQNVPDGFGGVEPRFTFNGTINSREEAFKVIQQITQSFRGMAYWSLGQVFATADMPEDPVKLVSPANVIDGQFNYNGTAMRARHSVALVSWNDPTDFFRPAIEVVTNDAMLQKFGWRQTDVQISGCTSRGQAHRFGKWVLDTEQHATESVEYTASWDHADVKPGNIISIADPRKAQVRTGGRLKAVDGYYVELDARFEATPGETYSLSVELPSGVVETRQVLEFEHLSNRLRLAQGFTETPVQGAMWVITGSDVVPRQYRVLTVSETDQHLFKVQALFHDPTKFARVEQGINFDPPPYSRPTDHIEPPSNVKARESLFFRNNVAHNRVTLSWTPSSDFMAKSYSISANSPDGFQQFGEVGNTSLDIDDCRPGNWTFYVTSVSYAGIMSQPVPCKLEVLGWEGVDGPYVSHLELFERGSETTFAGPDARVVWRNNFPGTTYEIGSEPSAGAGRNNPFYRDNVVRVFDVETNELVRVESVLTEDYTYTYAANSGDFGKLNKPPQRKFRIEVTVRDNLGRESKPATIVVENPVPAMIVPELTGGVEQIFCHYRYPDDIDFKGALIWCEKNEDFDPAVTKPAYDGPNNLVSLKGEPGVTYYVRVAGYDHFNRDNLNISPAQPIDSLIATFDTEPPPVPAGVTLRGEIETSPTGTVAARLLADWEAVQSDKLSHYEVAIQRDNGTELTYPSSTNHYEWGGLVPNERYTVRVRSVSLASYKSNYSDAVSKQLPKKDVGPGAPMALAATASLKSVFLTWINPVDADLAHVEIWSCPSEKRDDATCVGRSLTSAFTHSGLETGSRRYYWVRAINTSGAASTFSNSAAVTPGQVGEGDIAANAVTADHIRAGSISGNHISVEAELPSSIKVGGSGITLGRLTDPGTLINGGETLIDPGRIIVSGDTTLASWRDGSDATKISGGSIAANTISANKLVIGSRGLILEGILFSADKENGIVSWSAGSISYIGDAGTSVKTDIVAGQHAFAGKTLYVVWQKATGVLTAQEKLPAGGDLVTLAVYRGGSDLTANYGRTTIDGDQIITGTIQADRITAGSIGARELKANSISADHIAGKSITFDCMRGGTLSIAEAINVGSDRLQILSHEQKIAIRDGQTYIAPDGTTMHGRLRLEMGKIGPADDDYGFKAYDRNGNLMFGTGGWGTSAIPADALQGIPLGKIDGLSGIAKGEKINSGNIGTYIEGAAIHDAYIANLHGDKVLANSIWANRLVAGTVSARELSTGLLLTNQAQIGHAVIKSAHIGDLEVDTIKIRNGAVSNIATARLGPGWGRRDASAYIYARHGAKLLVIASVENGCNGSVLEVFHNGNRIGQVYPTGISYIIEMRHQGDGTYFPVMGTFYTGGIIQIATTANYEGTHTIMIRGDFASVSVIELAR